MGAEYMGKSYTETFWKNIDMSQTLAGEDPIWRQMMIDGYNDCYDVARSFPQSALDKNPIMKVSAVTWSSSSAPGRWRLTAATWPAPTTCWRPCTETPTTTTGPSTASPTTSTRGPPCS